MENQKKYKVSAYNILPKELNEDELRRFAIDIMNDQELGEVWIEKIQKDQIVDVVEWVKQSGYEVIEFQ